MNKEQLAFIARLVEVNKGKTEVSLSEEFKEMYRWSIRNGVRKKFIDQVKKNAAIVETIDDKTFLAAGTSMFTLAELLGEYIAFQHWLEKMTGNNFKEMK